MHQIIFLIEPSPNDAWETPVETGTLFMNRFTIEEDGAFEVIKIIRLKKSSFEMSTAKNEKVYGKNKILRRIKGRVYLKVKHFSATH